ncbi:MAG: calcium-binding protein [Egibacteraceae bacterium]
MRTVRLAALAIMMMLALVAGAGASHASSRPMCHGERATIRGDKGDDKIKGKHDKDDVIVGLRGDDEIDGRGGDDTICGNQGDDELEGNRGKDKLIGGRGDNELNARDGKKDAIVSGGPGYDICKIDRRDKTRGCEKIIRHR